MVWVGGVAQLGERLLCKQEVIGSIPFASTTDVALGAVGSAYGPHLGVRAASPCQRHGLRSLALLRWFCGVFAPRCGGWSLRPRRELCDGASREPAGTSFVLRMVVGSQAQQEHLVDALAPRGDEGRGTLRKAAGSCEQTLIRGCPNGETHPSGYPVMNP